MRYRLTTPYLLGVSFTTRNPKVAKFWLGRFGFNLTHALVVDGSMVNRYG